MPLGAFGLVTIAEQYPSIVHVFGNPNGPNNEVKGPDILTEIFCVEDFCTLWHFSSMLYDPNQEE